MATTPTDLQTEGPTQEADAGKSGRTSKEAAQRRREALAQLLASWREGDEEDLQDQRETGAFLRKALDEDRPSYRKFFA
jgi:hypothetical protein